MRFSQLERSSLDFVGKVCWQQEINQSIHQIIAQSQFRSELGELFDLWATMRYKVPKGAPDQEQMDEGEWGVIILLLVAHLKVKSI